MKRPVYLDLITRYFRNHPIVAILGPRQCGKTTLAKTFCHADNSFPRENYFDLEDPTDLGRLQQGKMVLDRLSGLIVIDEIQKIPDLFPILRVLVDDDHNNKQFLILGSASRELIRQSSETLAGRIAYIELTPFSYSETHELDHLWMRGGFPRSYLAESLEASLDWREFYIKTFLEQDIPNLGINISPVALRRFWTMLAHYHGNLFNASELGKSFGASDVTIRHYLDLLTGTFMVRQLQPWKENIKKRQVKAPKIYFRDTGILHSLLRIESEHSLMGYPKVGSSWEGFCIEEIIRGLQVNPSDCYFWSTYTGAELDLLIFKGQQRLGFEFKFSDAPKITKSMKISLQELSLDHLTVIYPGEIDYPLSEKVMAKGIKNYLDEL